MLMMAVLITFVMRIVYILKYKVYTYVENGNLIYYRKGSYWKYMQYDDDDNMTRYKDSYGCNFNCTYEEIC